MMQGIGQRFGRSNGFHRIRVTAIAVTLAAMLSLTGCKGFFTALTTGSTTPGSTTYAYISNYGGTVSAYTLTSGVLADISGSPLDLAYEPTCVAVAPNNESLYIGTSSGIYLYNIGTSGVLTEGNGSTIISATVPTAMAVDSTSGWLIVASASTTLQAIQLTAATGVPTGTLASATLSAASPSHIAIDPANSQIAVTLGVGGTDFFGFTASSSTPLGKEVTVPVKTSGNSANAVTYNSTSAYLFIAEATTSGGILRVMATATLGTDLYTPYAVGNGPSAVLADATDAYVYVANETDNSISGFSLTSTSGALTALADSPFATAKSPVALAEDSTESYVLAIGYGTNPNFWVYSFDATTGGTLDVTATTTTGTTDPSLSNGIALSH
jgi:6-phosphogluconolactonase (cycloisomerase 2 family)